MTSLQQQLSVIAATSTKQLDVKAQRSAHGKSLLFEPRVAVSQNFEVLYQICREGFEELCVLEPRFALFDSMFSEQSKDEEREQMNAAENKNLDVAINSFLDLAASKLLLKPCQKAVEWLIRRFRAHEYNTEHLLLVFLPYHSIPLFSSLMGILPTRLPPSFKFLKPYVASLTCPPIHTIIYSATNNSSLFAAINRQILGAAKARLAGSELIRFWTVIVSQAIDGMLSSAQSGIATVRKERMEAVLLQILPVLDEIFAMQGSPELEVAACMIITIIAARGDISDNVKARFMEAISSSWNPITVDARVVCLVALSQDVLPKRLPKKVAKRLLATTDLIERLVTISASYRATNLLVATFNYCVSRLQKSDCEQEITFVCQALRRGLLDEKNLRKALQTLVSKLASLSAEEANALQFIGDSSNQLLAIFKPATGSSLDIALRSLPRSTELVALESILQVTIQQESTGIDEMDIDEQTEVVSSKIELDLSELSMLNTPERSFFATTDSTVYNRIESLAAIAAKESHLEVLLAHPILKRDSNVQDDVTYPSFLLRIVFSKKAPTKLQHQAMTSLVSYISDVVDNGRDCQLLLPYMLLALQNQSHQIRNSAAQVIRLLARGFTKDSPPWGTAFYSMKATKLILTPDQFSALVRDNIVPRLQDCVANQTILGTVLKSYFNTKSKSARQTKAAICDNFGAHASASTILTTKMQLLELLHQFGKPALATLSTIGMQILKDWVALSEEDAQQLCTSQALVLRDVNLGMINAISSASPEALDYLGVLITGPNKRQDIVEPSQECLVLLWREMSIEKRQSILEKLVEMSLRDPKAGQSLRDASNQTLRNLPLDSEDLVSLLATLPKTAGLESPVVRKQRLTTDKATDVEKISTEAVQALRKYTRVLEIAESVTASQTTPQETLLTSLFRVIEELQNFGIQADSSMVYLKTLTINSLLAVVEKLKHSKEQPRQLSSIRIDLIVDTIANTPNIQLQQSCLLLISGLATWVPDVVLHSVMPIFTLMGSTVLRQADDFSAHVIDQTVSQVVPPLVASLRQRSKEVLAGLSEILISFSAAFEHIPAHRRIALFTHIVNALGAEDCLFAVICMIRIKYPTDLGTRQFSSELTDAFSPQLVLSSLVQSVGLVDDIFKNRQGISDTLLNVKDLGEAERQAMGDNLLHTIIDLLKYSKLRTRIASSMHYEVEGSAAQQTQFSNLMKSSIQVAKRLQSTTCHSVATEMLASVFGLLALEDLIICAQALLQGASDDVRDVVVTAVADKARTLKTMSSSGAQALINFLPTLDMSFEQASRAEQKMSVMDCCTRIAQKVGKKNPAALLPLITRIAGPQCLGSDSVSLAVQSLLAIAVLVRILKEEMLPQIPSLLTKSFDLLENNLLQENGNFDIHDAVFTVINAIGQTVPFALAGTFLDDALQLAQRSSAQLDESVPARSAFYESIAKRVDATEAFSAIERNFHIVQAQDFDSIVEYYKLAKSAIATHSKSIVLKNSTSLFKFVKRALDMRASRAAEGDVATLSIADIEELELLIIDIALSMVLKMNDATFRPFFLQLVDWASFKNKKPTAVQIARATTLFRLIQALLHRLRSLMTSYVSYVLEFGAHIIELPKEDMAVHRNLLLSTLRALTQSFDCDQDEYWQSPAHFASIKKPLLDLLDIDHDAETSATVISAVTAFASAANSADHFKSMNSDLLALFRSTTAATRLMAVKCQRGLTDVLGEDWLVHLPEMLPLITELLEDDDEKVERETRLWIKNVEETVGENLDSMLQ